MKTLYLKKSLLLLICLLAFASSRAQVKYLASADEVRAFTKKTSLLLKDNNTTEFFKVMKQYWPMPENELANLEEKTIKGFNLIAPRFGKVEDVVKIKEETIKDLGLRETYFIKYQYSVVRLIYTYYRNNNGWTINGFKWDTEFSNEFQ